MKIIRYSQEKNLLLKRGRNISFEDIEILLENGELLDDIEHPNSEKYGHQRIFVFYFKKYIYLVPYVETESEIFLKTIIPSRKMLKKYINLIKEKK